MILNFIVVNLTSIYLLLLYIYVYVALIREVVVVVGSSCGVELNK